MMCNISQLGLQLFIVFTFSCLQTASAMASTSVFSFGWNGAGATGMGTQNGNTTVATAILTTNLGGRGITQVAAGWDHSLLLADDGSVFSFGYNGDGRTGLGTRFDDTLVATAIDTSNLGGRKVTQVAAGEYHSLLLADDGSVFSFGWNYQGLTGLGIDDGGSWTTIATPIIAANIGTRKITQLAAGNYHNLLLAEDGTVFSFGSNFAYGQTGLGVTSGSTLVATPINTTNLGDRKITQIAAGDHHSLLLADDGSVYVFGGSYGRYDSFISPVAIGIDTSNLGGRKIMQVTAGWNHSLLLAEDGTVFSFGRALEGQLGLGETMFTPIATPINTIHLGDQRVIRIAAGSFHNLLLTEQGRVFSFGRVAFGRTGHGIDGDTPDDEDILVATPIVTTNIGSRAVSQVAAGGFHSLVLVLSPNGDFNNDGVVDASDYVVWRKGLGSTYDDSDYTLWRSNFGVPILAEAAAVRSVPEPGILLLAISALLSRGWPCRFRNHGFLL